MKRKNLKRVAFLLSLCLFGGTLDCTVIASKGFAVAVNANDTLKSGICGTNVAWTLDSNGTLTISGDGDMKDYSKGKTPWLDNRESIKKIIIENGVTSIGGDSFRNCTNLTSVSISNTVRDIGNGSFCGCTNLTSITIPEGVTRIGYSTFSLCSKLREIIIPESVEVIEAQAFFNTPWLYNNRAKTPLFIVNNILIDGTTCTGDITIPYGVKSIVGEAFYECQSVTSIKMPDTVTSVGGDAFSGCSNLTSISVSNSLTVIAPDLFLDCEKLSSITIPDSVTYVGQMAFCSCNSIEAVVLPESVTSINAVSFGNCKNLKEITILNPKCEIFKDSYKNSNGKGCGTISNEFSFENYSGTFDGVIYGYDNSTAEIYAKKYGYKFKSLGTAPNTSNLSTPFSEIVARGTCGEELNWTLDNMGALTICGSGNMDVFDYDDAPWRDYIDEIQIIVIEDGVNSISEYAFSECSNSVLVKLPDSLTYIGEGAFFNNCSLVEINIPDSINSLADSLFTDCFSLVSARIPESVTKIEKYAFSDCKSLSTVIMPVSVASIEEGAFCACDKLENITILNPECIISDNVDTICNKYDFQAQTVTYTGKISGYENSTAQLYAEKNGFIFENINNAPSGDVNGDGELNIADIVLFQKWLLANPDAKLVNWKAADLCEDGKLDVFDLCLMRRKLIYG